jgi:hypothetical protein
VLTRCVCVQELHVFAPTGLQGFFEKAGFTVRTPRPPCPSVRYAVHHRPVRYAVHHRPPCVCVCARVRADCVCVRACVHVLLTPTAHSEIPVRYAVHHRPPCVCVCYQMYGSGQSSVGHTAGYWTYVPQDTRPMRWQRGDTPATLPRGRGPNIVQVRAPSIEPRAPSVPAVCLWVTTAIQG